MHSMNGLLTSHYRTQKCRKPIINRVIFLSNNRYPRIIHSGTPIEDAESKNAMLNIDCNITGVYECAAPILNHLAENVVVGNVVYARSIRSITKLILRTDWSIWKHAVGDSKYNKIEYAGHLYLDSMGDPKTSIICHGTRNNVRCLNLPGAIPIHSHPYTTWSSDLPSPADYASGIVYSLLVTEHGITIYCTLDGGNLTIDEMCAIREMDPYIIVYRAYFKLGFIRKLIPWCVIQRQSRKL